eukprot:TRINITY_DN985_c0_g1_i1.p1 TRINITY_DN985_c0_g1~~TRINITY_DN985_c0_g1_i1.p1  ORF type:complete len:608 (-),score=27.74 TRINITY_DN985_c0_g1_i1:83-1750(-)
MPTDLLDWAGSTGGSKVGFGCSQQDKHQRRPQSPPMDPAVLAQHGSALVARSIAKLANYGEVNAEELVQLLASHKTPKPAKKALCTQLLYLLEEQRWVSWLRDNLCKRVTLVDVSQFTEQVVTKNVSKCTNCCLLLSLRCNATAMQQTFNNSNNNSQSNATPDVNTSSPSAHNVNNTSHNSSTNNNLNTSTSSAVLRYLYAPLRPSHCVLLDSLDGTPLGDVLAPGVVPQPRVLRDAIIDGSLAKLLLPSGATSASGVELLIVPMEHPGESGGAPMGVLVAIGSDFTTEDIAIGSCVAAHCAMALRHVRVHRERVIFEKCLQYTVALLQPTTSEEIQSAMPTPAPSTSSQDLLSPPQSNPTNNKNSRLHKRRGTATLHSDGLTGGMMIGAGVAGLADAMRVMGHRISKQCCALMNCAGCNVLKVDHGDLTITLVYSKTGDQFVSSLYKPSLASTSSMLKQVLSVKDAKADARFDASIDARGFMPHDADGNSTQPPIQAILCLPVQYNNDVVGVLQCINPLPPNTFFRSEDACLGVVYCEQLMAICGTFFTGDSLM